ncbi:BTB/POZ and MATH domain-containing protein 2-like [Triticum urartu]|uniref:BTB/POZ and MATH domain-containing protein 2-like n=1 Tax=Triticum urartu TaxID=4572 RepID=UPI0020446AA6|nr:BTB/POZ and MATH domain-containing protein 2-like [Triticum urartu]
MSSFAGVSVVDGVDLCPPCAGSACETSADCGYHLLVVQDYSRAKEKAPTGESIISRPFRVGCHTWQIELFPNGDNPSCADFVSLYVCRLDDYLNNAVDAKFSLSFVDQAEKQKPVYILGTETCSFPHGGSRGHRKFMRKDALERSENMRRDGFTVRCDIMICCEEDDASGTGPPRYICQHFSTLLESKVGADVTFEVSGETFAAHRCVLAARSTVFMAQLFGPMKEGTTSSVIRIEDMEAKVFRALLRFIYTDSFPEMEKECVREEAQDVEQGQEEDEMHLQWLQGLFTAADRYDLQHLKFICEKRLSEDIGVSSVASTLVLAEQHDCSGLKMACFKFIQAQSSSCLKRVMSTNGWGHLMMTYPSILNEVIAKLASKKRKKHST